MALIRAFLERAPRCWPLRRRWSLIFVLAVLAAAGCGHATVQADASGWRVVTKELPSKSLETSASDHLLSFVDARHGWYAASAGLMATSDGGAHWRRCLGRVSLGNGSTRSLRGIRVARQVFAFPDGSIRLTIDGWGRGPAWTGGAVLTSNDRGRSWRQSISLQGTPYNASATWWSSGDRGWLLESRANAAGSVSEKRLLRTTDGGRSWQKLHTWDTRRTFGHWQSSTLRFADGRHGWIVAPAHGEEAIIATSDGGRTWPIHSHAPPPSPHQIYVYDASHLWGAGAYWMESESGGALTASVDGGRFWQEVPSLPSQPYGDVFFQTPEMGWVSTRDGVLATTDGGDSWQLEIPSKSGESSFGLCSAGGGVVAVDWASGKLFMRASQ